MSVPALPQTTWHAGRSVGSWALSLACGLVGWCAIGCLSLSSLQTGEVPQAASHAESGSQPAPAGHEVGAVDPAAAKALRLLLEQPAWQTDLGWSVLGTERPGPTRPWRYIFLPKTSPDATHAAEFDGRALFEGTVEGLEESTLNSLDALLESWCGGSDVVSLNATLLRARWLLQRQLPLGDSELLRLQTIAEGQIEPAPSMMVRSAATEVWCRSLCLQPGPWEQTLLPAGQLLERAGLPDEIRGTLWRILAEKVPPDRLPGLSRSLANRQQGTLRRAALEACVLYACQHPGLPGDHPDWPAVLPELRRDPDPVVRQLFARWASLGDPESNFTWLRELVRDVEPAVQTQAVLDLRWVHATAARDLLRELRRSESERMRATAVMASSAWGLDELQGMQQDASPTVRLAVAKSLSQFPTADAQRWLRDFLTDESLEVQATAVSSVTDWPAELAVPVLLDAVCHSALKTRQMAAELLSSHFCAGTNLPWEATYAERETAVRQLVAAQGWRWQSRVLSSTKVAEPPDHQPSSERMAFLVQSYLEAAATGSLSLDPWETMLKPVDLPTLEQVLVQLSPADRKTIVQSLLPRIAPLYTALQGLESREVHLRRQAAKKLAELAASHPLSPFFLDQLLDRISTEQDQLVWQACMTAVQRESHPHAARVALLALHSPWPDVRLLGVRYLAEHPHPEVALWLLPLFRDPHRSVRLAAIAATGYCHNVLALEGLSAGEQGTSHPGLRAMLTDPDPEIQWTALEAMLRLQDQAASDELLRRTFDPRPAVRERAVVIIGAVGHSRFVEPLLKMAWTEPDMHVKRAIVSSLEALVPPERQPAYSTGLAGFPSIDDKIQTWITWWTSSSRTPPLSPEAISFHEQILSETTDK